jgi:hypothetical protein
MAALLPIDSTDSWVEFTTTLDGADYIIELAFNTRDARWYLTLYTADREVLLESVPLVVDYPLSGRVAWNPATPPGLLMALDMTGAGREIAAQEELGTRVQLLYRTADEVAGG